MGGNIKVMLSTEGTYPFHQGGVSTWCDILLKQIKAVDYYLYSVIMNPFVTQKFKLPNDDALIKVPLWGTEEPSEHFTTPFSYTYRMKKNTLESNIQLEFIPIFDEVVKEIISVNKDPFKFANLLVEMYRYFQKYEYKVTFKSEQTWNVYKDIILEAAMKGENKLGQPDIFGLNQSLGWLYRFFTIINTPLPEDVHVTHSSAAAFCGIPCVLLKLLNKTPYLLTEHGVYIREQYLSLSRNQYSSFLNTFLIRMVNSITTMNYALADQVSPVCNYNTRWERRLGVKPSNIQVIYNGVDETVFIEANGMPQAAPTVVMVARIDPIKDIVTFLRAAALVKDVIPDVKFIVYGSASVPSYYDQCLLLKEELELGNSFIFAGHTSNMSAAYQSGDITVLSSTSEAFPYSVVEAMMTGKPVVATDVGGVKEALGDTGILVETRNPAALAEGIIKLLENKELRDELGREARERALNYFTLDRVLELHMKSYIKLAIRAKEPKDDDRNQNDAVPPNILNSQIKQQKLYLERAYALISFGFHDKAIELLNQALILQPHSKLTPILMAELAKIYYRIGEPDKAHQELEKCKAYTTLVG